MKIRLSRVSNKIKINRKNKLRFNKTSKINVNRKSTSVNKRMRLKFGSSTRLTNTPTFNNPMKNINVKVNKHLYNKNTLRLYQSGSGRQIQHSQTFLRSSVDIESYPPPGYNTGLNTCKQGEEVVIERFGKYNRTCKPGLFLAIPFVENLAYIVDTRELTIPIPQQNAVTKDNVSVQVGGSVFIQVIDVEKACYGARKPLIAITQHSTSSMRSCIGKFELDELFHNRVKLNRDLRESIADACSPWGFSVLRYEVTDIIPDIEVAKSMDLQAITERERRQEKLAAEADKQSRTLISEGKRQEAINLSEGVKLQSIREAEGRSEAIKLEAIAVGKSMQIIADQLKTEEGRQSMQFALANKYMEQLSETFKNSKMNTVFLSQDVGKVNNLLAEGMGVLNSLEGLKINPQDNTTKDKKKI